MEAVRDIAAQTTTFDPYGERMAEGTPYVASQAGDRLARRIGGAVFWSLALAIMAGRIYSFNMPEVRSVYAAVAQVVAMR